MWKYCIIFGFLLLLVLNAATTSAHDPSLTADNTNIYTNPVSGSNWYSPTGYMTTTWVTSGWNQPRPFGVHNHYGTDFSVSAGTNLVAPVSGTVIQYYYDSCWGNTLVIEHGGNKYSKYMHLTSASAGVGQYVSSGQQVAVSGATGSTDCIAGAHLHYEVVTANPTYPSGTDPQSIRTNPTPFFQWISSSWANSMSFIRNETVVTSRYLRADVSARETSGDVSQSYISVKFWYKYCSTCTWYSIAGQSVGGTTYQADLATQGVKGTIYWMAEGTRSDPDMSGHHNKSWSPGKWRVPNLGGPNYWSSNSFTAYISW